MLRGCASDLSMVLFSIGVLATSIVFLYYRFWFKRWDAKDRGSGAKAIQQASHLKDDKRNDSIGSNGHAISPKEWKSAATMKEPTTPPSDDDLSEDGASTPKARPQQSQQVGIPTLTLDDDPSTGIHLKSREWDPTKPTSNPTQPRLPSTKGNGNSQAMPPPPKPSASSLMPPPAVKPSALRPLPKPGGGSLNPPPSAASLQRGPPAGSHTSVQSALAASLSTSTLAPANRPSRKVVLEPGHSPLDWAALTRNPPMPTFLRGKDVPPHLIKVPPSELKLRNGRRGRDAWGTYKGKVYNLTPYLKFHPGGVGEIMRGAGKVGEAERLFNEIHPWVNWDNMLGECLIGILVSEPEAVEENKLDTLD